MKQEMLIQFFLLAAFLFIGGIVTASAQNGDCAGTLTGEDSGREVCLQEGKQLCLRLNAQLATGFSWQVTKNQPEKLKLVSESTEKAGDEEVSREIQVFIFKAIAKGEFDFEMSYSRPWEKDKQPMRKYKLRVMIY